MSEFFLVWYNYLMSGFAKKHFPNFLRRENITALSMIVAVSGISLALAFSGAVFARLNSLREAKEKRHSAYEDELRQLSGLTVNLAPAPDPTVDWKTYRNSKYGVSLKYPRSWQDSRESSAGDQEKYILKISFDEKGVASPAGVKGFDIFVYGAQKFSGPIGTDNLKKKNGDIPDQDCPKIDDITLGEQGHSAKEVNISADNPCWEETFFYSLTKNGYIFNLVPRQEMGEKILEDRKKIDILRNFPEFYDVVSTLDFSETQTESIVQLSKQVAQKAIAPPKVRFTSGATCAHKKDKPSRSKTKGKHMDEDCCPDPDKWPNPRCAYSAKGLAIMLPPR